MSTVKNLNLAARVVLHSNLESSKKREIISEIRNFIDIIETIEQDEVSELEIVKLIKEVVL